MAMALLALNLAHILMPVVASIGIAAVHCGMLMMSTLGVGLITPLVGAVISVGSANRRVAHRAGGMGDVALLRHCAHGPAAGHVPAAHLAVAVARDRGMTP
jgi:hypothetical protein